MLPMDATAQQQSLSKSPSTRSYQVAREGDLRNASVYAIVVVYSLDGLCGADLLTASGAPAGGWK